MGYRRLLMMRARGLSGPFFAKHLSFKKLSTSVGNFIAGGTPPPSQFTIDATTTTIDSTTITIDKTLA